MYSMNHVPTIFGIDVFSQSVMKARQRPEVFCAWQNAIRNRTPLELAVAEEIATAMKDWAIEKGATHYSHWFQPMTGITAEKHDSFITPVSSDQIAMTFSGKSLICGEPDASSFPSGGLRATFEARGYTAWDPTAFAFIRDSSLYIPTCFFSYDGTALDMKTPLLRSIDAVSHEALRVVRLFGDHTTHRIIPCVGAEQEYFLIPKDLYLQREDLRLTGRTLFGALPPKGQELDDHYLGTIRSRISLFMQDLDTQLWRLGIPAKTRHNEAAPCQHELAPIYSDASSACDGNQLMMQVIKKCAGKHNLVCLLHEKPFAGVNGSGKHNNWSLTTDTGENLFSPGTTPQQNARFLLFLAAFIKGIDIYQDFLRCTAATAGNDHRLGADEAPPAVISISLGEELTKVINTVIHGTDSKCADKTAIRIGIDAIPAIPKDTADRNRTSPLAFTGNKFEFRMLGASQSIAETNVALNTIMAEILSEFAHMLENSDDFHNDLHSLVCQTFTQHQRIIFNGNGYSSDWDTEAAKRGLSNYKSTAECLNMYVSNQNMDLVIKRGIYTKREFLARHQVHMQFYCKMIRIEAKTCIHMVQRQILPAAHKYCNMLCQSIQTKSALGIHCAAETAFSERISTAADAVYCKCEKLIGDLKNVPEDDTQAVRYYRNVIAKDMESIRMDADVLEELTDAAVWPYPTYSEILYY